MVYAIFFLLTGLDLYKKNVPIQYSLLYSEVFLKIQYYIDHP